MKLMKGGLAGLLLLAAALDRSDAGVRERWFERELSEGIRPPGVLQAQGYGDEVSTRTPWVLSLCDRFWFMREGYKPYTRPGSGRVLRRRGAR